MLYTRFTKEDVISYIRQFHQETGKRPFKRTWRDYAIQKNYPSYTTIRTMFGGWRKALILAGFEMPPRTPAQDAAAASPERKRRGRKRGFPNRRRDNLGYTQIWVPENKHGKPGYIYEHRQVMAQIMGRPLESFEVVHHKNGVKTDNRPENLEIVSKRTHRGTIRCPHCLKDYTIN